MEVEDVGYAAALERVLGAERQRLVRWCAYLVRDTEVAEDLAQETFSAAWRSARHPARTEELPAWLAGIARNVCRSWQRRQRRELAHVFQLINDDDSGAISPLDSVADTFELDVALERDELALLLDRALALLPDDTRQALVAKYIDESPLAEVAARMGMSESALAARLHRGKLALRRVLTTELRDEAASYGLVSPETEGWRETRIWCPDCAASRLVGRLSPATGVFSLRCPGCYERSPIDFANWREEALFDGLSSYRAALSRLSRRAHTFYRRGLRDGAAACARCGGNAVVLSTRTLSFGGAIPAKLGLRVICEQCDAHYMVDLASLALCHPTAQRFWREHPRMLTLPESEVEYGGHPAALTTFVSKNGSARLDVISDRESFVIRHVSEGA